MIAAKALVLISPEPEKGGRGKKVDDQTLKKLEGLGKTRHTAEQRLSQARTVLAFSRELAMGELNSRWEFCWRFQRHRAGAGGLGASVVAGFLR